MVSDGESTTTLGQWLITLTGKHLHFNSNLASVSSHWIILCPMDWLSHRGKCYWFSKDSKSWNESRADCSEKSSRKLVIQDREELEFIQNCTQGKYHVWLGLSFTSPEKNWTWVDSSMLDQTLFPVTGPADVNSCGVIKGNRIHSETCSAEFKWICQKEAVLL
uniref:C-type lectin domain-containing protein n=1 Tax=Chelydra serpentina TaxID=8475 RepID=A0A8C3SGU7_CHESE